MCPPKYPPAEIVPYTVMLSLVARGKVSRELSTDGADMDRLTKEMDRLQNAIEAVNGWELDRVLERAMDALRCPSGDAIVDNLSGQGYPM